MRENKLLFAIKYIIVTMMTLSVIFSLSACSTEQEKEEKKIIKSANEYILQSDYESAQKILSEFIADNPESSNAKQLLENIEPFIKEKTPTVEEATNRYYEMRLLYNKWFERADISYRKDDAVKIKDNKNTVTAYRVNDISTKKELDEMFLKYCSEELYKSFNSGNIKYYDHKGKLYVSIKKSYYSASIKEYGDNVEKANEDDFVFTCYRIKNNTTFYTCTQHLSLVNNKFKFLPEVITEIEKLPGLEKGTYYVSKDEGLDLREGEYEQSELMITLKKWTKVECYGCIGDYAYVCYDNSSYGFVKADDLAEKRGYSYSDSNENNKENSKDESENVKKFFKKIFG